MAKTVFYRIKRNGKYLQTVDANERYCSSGRAPTMGVKHSWSEYKTIWGDEVYLTEVNYNGCDVVDELIQLTIKDFEEIDKPIIVADDSDEEIKPIKHNYKRNNDDDDLDI